MAAGPSLRPDRAAVLRTRPFRYALLTLSALLLLYDVGIGVSQFLPWADYGMWVSASGKVLAVAPHGPAERRGVREGDQLVPVPRSALAGFQAAWVPPARSVLAIRTAADVARVTPAPRNVIDALLIALESLAGAVFLAAATFLAVRRPGPMALSLWLFATGSVDVGPVQAPFLGMLPAPLAFAVWLAVSGPAAIAQNLAIVPFALRFPDGRIHPRLRVAERAAWIVFGIAALAGLGLMAASSLNDRAYNLAVNAITTFAQILIVAAAILVLRFFRMDDAGRAKTAWALVGFCGSLIVLEIPQGLAQLAIRLAPTISGAEFNWLVRLGVVLTIVGSLLPLCAVYPVLRYRLFELGFVVNRATLFSMLMLAAIGTLAGVNWLAQRIVSEKLALIAQPVAAIVIGLGYMRVREITKKALERAFFRRRFRAERHLTELAASLATTISVDAIDAMVASEAAATLELRSAAVFRSVGSALVRATSVGWDDATRGALDAASSDPRELLALDGLPAPPDEPVLAVPLRSAGELLGVVFYGRHHDQTEIDPEERALLLRICAAAAPAYQIALLKAHLTQAERASSAAPVPAQPAADEVRLP